MRPHVTLHCTPDRDHRIVMDEALVAPFDLPRLLGSDADPLDWPARRAALLMQFEDHVFGRVPKFELTTAFEPTEEGSGFDGRAVRRQGRLRLLAGTEQISLTIELLLYLPADAFDPVPVFLVPNFEGNHTIAHDPHIVESFGARRDRGDDLAPRGSKVRRFPIRTIVDRGYGLATFYAADVDSDSDDGFAHGVHRAGYVRGQHAPAADEWGTIGAWAWACSRVADLLRDDPSIDGDRVIVGGHSRLGKTALWAAARDTRFAAAFANDSGCTGAALSRRRFGENVAVINDLFPHWFCRNYRCYANNEANLPIDQHQLIALIAPRPVHIASADGDLWADPRGEFLATLAASEAWEHLGGEGLGLREFPDPGDWSIGQVGYHLRKGEHDMLAFDWERFLDFADQL